MKTFPVLSICCLILTLSSCTPYQYAPQLPATPMFSGGNQFEMQGSIGMNHCQAQVSYSPINSWAISSNHFLSYDSGMAHSLTLHYYRKFPTRPVYFTAKLGYERGLLTNSVGFQSLNLENGGKRFYKTTNYYSNLVSAGFYWSPKKNYWFELDQTITKTTFLLIHYHAVEWEKKTARHNYFMNVRPLERLTYGAMLSMRIDDGGLFFFKQSIGVNVLISDPLVILPSNSNYSQTIPTYHRKTLYDDYFVYMITLGFRLGVNSKS